jgi:tRNA dimethylallyltransferase
MDREKLYNRIEKRIDIMLKDGLVEEVKSLYPKYDENLVSMRGLGYKEIVYYLKGELSLEESITLLKRDTRHFAKRQLTWFNHQCDGKWINVDNFTSTQEIAIYIKNEIARNKKC